MKDIDIIFSDNHLLVVNKPCGLLTQPNETGNDNLQDLAKQWVKMSLNKTGNVFLHPIHRLDKPVSGIVVFARTSKALSRLNEAMRNRQYKKHYMAWVEGLFEQKTGQLEDHLLHDDHRARIVPSSHPDGKKSILTYEILKEKDQHTLLGIEIETGRYHQIRIQLSARGHSIFGDVKYGSRIAYRENAIALHHDYLEIPHPITQETMKFRTEAPFL